MDEMRAELEKLDAWLAGNPKHKKIDDVREQRRALADELRNAELTAAEVDAYARTHGAPMISTDEAPATVAKDTPEE